VVSYNTLLSIIARIHPAIWDAIIPHGHRAGAVGASRVDRVALNPQPLPPRETFLLGAAEMAHDIVKTALEIEAHGESSFGFVSDVIDDWCGTPWPRKWPVPWPGPGPQPDPWDAMDVQAARVIGAIIFSSVAMRLPDEKFSAVFADGAERLTEAALGGTPTRGAQPAVRGKKSR
jgi:hypothetical protein